MLQFPALLNCVSSGKVPAGFAAMYANYGATLPAVVIIAATISLVYSKPKTMFFLGAQIALFVAALLAIAPGLNMLSVAKFGLPFDCSNPYVVRVLSYGNVIAWLAALSAGIGLVLTASEMISIARKRSVD